MREHIGPIQATVSGHRGHPWHVTGVTDLRDVASHDCAILHGPGLAVFAKLTTPAESAAELHALRLLRRHAVPVPAPIADVRVATGSLLLTEAVPSVPRGDRQWRSIGTVLAETHRIAGSSFGAPFDGYFGPFPQDNRPAGSWPEFFGARRLEPRLRSAVDAGRVDPAVAAGVSRVLARLPELCGPPASPRLVHGDAQQNNFVTGPDRTWLVDTAAHFGHPEVDLALLDYFEPVPAAVFDAYREITPIDPGFAERRELWRLPAYLAVVTASGDRSFADRIAAAVAPHQS